MQHHHRHVFILLKKTWFLFTGSHDQQSGVDLKGKLFQSESNVMCMLREMLKSVELVCTKLQLLLILICIIFL